MLSASGLIQKAGGGGGGVLSSASGPIQTAGKEEGLFLQKRGRYHI